LVLAAGATCAASAADCADHLIASAGYTRDASHWTEFAASGRKLVHETGALNGVVVSVDSRCNSWVYQAQVLGLKGHRSYDGQTNTGVAVKSQSQLRQLGWNFQSGWNINEAWQLRGRLSGLTTWRDIASAGGASGYPERFDWTLASLGAQWQTTLGQSHWVLGVWSGMQLNSSMRFNLPGSDQTRLSLGSIRTNELVAAWHTQIGPSWHLAVDTGYRRTDIHQGPFGVIQRNGVAVGAATQPRTTLVDVPITFSADYTF
jgi:hypothetical protein